MNSYHKAKRNISKTPTSPTLVALIAIIALMGSYIAQVPFLIERDKDIEHAKNWEDYYLSRTLPRFL